VLAASGHAPDPGLLRRCAAVLERGGLLIYPTDTLYALGGRALDADVGERVRRAKGRDEGKPLPVIAADLRQVEALAASLPAALTELAERFWPGPLTVVLRASPLVPASVAAGSGTVAVRVPALALARSLCALAGPLVSTSANRSGGRAPLTCSAALEAVGTAAALALDAGPGGTLPSTIVDLSRPEPRLLRDGALPWEQVLAVLRSPGPC
jgi:L-threonylcarbamoyladenylate synthase